MAIARQPTDETSARNRWLYLSGCILIVALAAVIRIRAAQNDLWLDEIWSLDFAATISSPAEVFTKIHHDNNHYFTTLWFYVIGPHSSSLVYRLPSIIAGVGTVILAGLIGRRRSMATAILAMAVTTASYVLILYSSEARGQAPVIFCAFLSYYLLDRYFKQPSIRSALWFSFSAVLGFLSHLIFLNFYLAALSWSAYHLITSKRALRSTIQKESGLAKSFAAAMTSLHGLPIAFLAVLYFVDIKHIRVGGGTSIALLQASFDFLTWALGPPPADWMRPLSCLITIAVLAAGILLLWRERSDSTLFFIGVIVIFPILLALISRIESLYLRHFILGIAFLLILFSFVLDWIWAQRIWGKAVCFILLAGFFAANSFPLASLFKNGRGHYRDAARFMAEHSRRNVVTVGSDHDLRIPMVLQFYAQEAIGNKVGPYYRHEAWPPEGPEWVICHKESFENPAPPATFLTDQAGNRYDLVQTFPTAPLSGLHWFIYQQRPW
jgi:hypothetical protein